MIQVVDFYMMLLNQTYYNNKKDIYCFGSSFMKLLYKNGVTDYSDVRRYTTSKVNNIDVSKLKKIFTIINIDNTHWTLGIINTTTNKIMYYDSLNASYDDALPYLEALKYWIEKELITKFKLTV
jgi:sentrin-specific protease 1